MSYRRQTVHKWIRNLPIDHLQLSGGRPSYVRRESSTIGSLFKAIDSGAFPRSSEAAVRRIKRTLDALLSALAGPESVEGWDRFRKTRPSLLSYKAIFFASPKFGRLDAREQRAPVARLNLSRRATNVLQDVGIVTISQLAARAETGLVGLAQVGDITAREIVATLDALSDAINADGSINWPKFASIRGFRVLPDKPSLATPRDFIQQFPSLCEAAVASTFSADSVKILKTRLFQSADAKLARREIGQRIGKNRETVRLHENEILDALRSAIWQEEYCGCQFRFRQDFMAPLHHLQTAAKAINNLRSWRSALQNCWGVDRNAISGQEILLLRLLNKDPELIRLESPEARRVNRMIRSFIAKNRVRSFTVADLRQELLGKLGRLALTNGELADILQGSPILQKADDGAFSVRFDQLSFADQCEVILRRRGHPTHIGNVNSDILALSQGALVRSRQETASVMCASPRFAALGKSGYWALREWRDVETRKIVDIAADLLASAKCPQHQRDLFRLIKIRRQLSPRSLPSLLRYDKRFVKIAPAIWALKPERS